LLALKFSLSACRCSGFSWSLRRNQIFRSHKPMNCIRIHYADTLIPHLHADWGQFPAGRVRAKLSEFRLWICPWPRRRRKSQMDPANSAQEVWGTHIVQRCRLLACSTRRLWVACGAV
jgi:hypothetical protein